MQHPQNRVASSPHAVHRLGFALGERKHSVRSGTCKTAPLGLLMQRPVSVLCQLQIYLHSLSRPASGWVFCSYLRDG